MKQVCKEFNNVHFLDQSVVEIQDDETGEVIVFIGCILWSQIRQESQNYVEKVGHSYDSLYSQHTSIGWIF